MSSHGLGQLLRDESASPSHQLHSNATPHSHEHALQQELVQTLEISSAQADALTNNGKLKMMAAYLATCVPTGALTPYLGACLQPRHPACAPAAGIAHIGHTPLTSRVCR